MNVRIVEKVKKDYFKQVFVDIPKSTIINCTAKLINIFLEILNEKEIIIFGDYDIFIYYKSDNHIEKNIYNTIKVRNTFSEIILSEELIKKLSHNNENIKLSIDFPLNTEYEFINSVYGDLSLQINIKGNIDITLNTNKVENLNNYINYDDIEKIKNEIKIEIINNYKNELNNIQNKMNTIKKEIDNYYEENIKNQNKKSVTILKKINNFIKSNKKNKTKKFENNIKSEKFRKEKIINSELENEECIEIRIKQFDSNARHSIEELMNMDITYLDALDE